MKNITQFKLMCAAILLLVAASVQEVKAAYTTDLPYVELTTAQEPNKGIWYFWFMGTTEEDNNSIWVDWNNNGQYDDGEACPPSGDQSGEVVSQTIRVYGNISLFSCNENSITKIDLSNNNLIEKLYFTNNQVESVDVSHLTNLIEFCCNGNMLATIDVSNNLNLEVFNCSNNLLTTLDVSKNTKLKELECGQNEIANLDVSNNSKMETLYCNDLKITSIDVSKNPALYLLNIANNKISEIDLTKCPLFNGIDCRNTLIEDLDFSGNPSLAQIICDDTYISSLDISQTPNLQLLSCANCNLTELDLSKHSKLGKVIVNNNKLQQLDFSATTTDLFEVYCYMNNISEENMGKLIESLPDATNASMEGWIFVIDTEDTKELNVCNTEQVKAATKKRWEVYDFKGGSNYGLNNYEGSEPSASLQVINGNRIEVWASNSVININVTEKWVGTDVKIYDQAGTLKYSGDINDTNMRIGNLEKGIYIVAVGQRAWKVIL